MSTNYGKFQRKPEIQTLLHKFEAIITLIVEKYHNEVVWTHGKDRYRANMSITHTTQMTEDGNQYLKGEGIGTRVRHAPIATQEDIFALL